MPEAVTPSDAHVRFKIAERMIGVGIIGIVVLSAVAIYYAKAEDRPEMARLVFASVLPLLGTWVGTVLAFYFAKDHFQAARDATRETLMQAGTFGEDSRVDDVMTTLGKINPIGLLQTWQQLMTCSWGTLSAAMLTTGNHRVSVISEKTSARLLVTYQPDINDYAQLVPVEVANLQPMPP